jgi:hypothetical protein
MLPCMLGLGRPRRCRYWRRRAGAPSGRAKHQARRHRHWSPSRSACRVPADPVLVAEDRSADGVRDRPGPEPGPSLVRGTRRNEGQPRIITDTVHAAQGLSCQLDSRAVCRLQRRGQRAELRGRLPLRPCTLTASSAPFRRRGFGRWAQPERRLGWLHGWAIYWSSTIERGKA